MNGEEAEPPGGRGVIDQAGWDSEGPWEARTENAMVSGHVSLVDAGFLDVCTLWEPGGPANLAHQ